MQSYISKAAWISRLVRSTVSVGMLMLPLPWDEPGAATGFVKRLLMERSICRRL